MAVAALATLRIACATDNDAGLEQITVVAIGISNMTAASAGDVSREQMLSQPILRPAAVLENLNLSLLGMSFLTRLQGYEMRDGRLTITW